MWTRGVLPATAREPPSPRRASAPANRRIRAPPAPRERPTAPWSPRSPRGDRVLSGSCPGTRSTGGGGDAELVDQEREDVRRPAGRGQLQGESGAYLQRGCGPGKVVGGA